MLCGSLGHQWDCLSGSQRYPILNTLHITFVPPSHFLPYWFILEPSTPYDKHSNPCFCFFFQDIPPCQLLIASHGTHSEGCKQKKKINEIIWLRARKTDGISDYNWLSQEKPKKRKFIGVEEEIIQWHKELGRPQHLAFHISTGRADGIIKEIQFNYHPHYSNGTDFTEHKPWH